MRGTYCLIINMPERTRMRIGALGTFEFPEGVYVYVGSALSGLEKRVSRHVSSSKKMRWHIDYFLKKADVMSVVKIPASRKDVECAVIRALMCCPEASVPVKGLGSSDCTCKSHLIYFGNSDPEWIAEEIAMRLSLLPDLYQKTRG